MNYHKIFINDSYNKIIIDSLKYLLIEHKAKLFAYVIMPSHLHLLLYIPINESIIDFMRDFKKFTSIEIRKLAQKENRYDLLEKFKLNARAVKNQKYKVWMDRFDDLIIISDKQFRIKINYIHFNPVKAKLVNEPEDFIYSSARNYLKNDQTIINITTVGV